MFRSLAVSTENDTINAQDEINVAHLISIYSIIEQMKFAAASLHMPGHKWKPDQNLEVVWKPPGGLVSEFMQLYHCQDHCWTIQAKSWHITLIS